MPHNTSKMRYVVNCQRPLGFSGIILTLRHNSELSHKQHMREVSAQRKSLRVGLLEELVATQNSFNGNIDALASGQCEGGLHFPTTVFDDIFRSSTDKLGLLTSNEIKSVMRAYHAIREVPHKLCIISSNQPNSSGYIGISPQQTQIVRELLENQLVNVNEAIAEIQNNS